MNKLAWKLSGEVLEKTEAGQDFKSALEDAKKQLEIANNHFNNATGNSVDIATYELKVAALRLDKVIREAKGREKFEEE